MPKRFGEATASHQSKTNVNVTRYKYHRMGIKTGIEQVGLDHVVGHPG